MGRNTRLKPKPFAAPIALFPIALVANGPLDMIPVVSDPTGRGAHALRIFNNLTITEGEHAGKRIGDNSPLWQQRLVRLIFGHTDELGQRVLREAFVCMAKKNGKSSFAAALALTWLLLNQEQRELVVCLAANRMQARLIFDTMVAMIKADDKLMELFEIVDHRHAAKYLPTHSIVKAISAELASIVGGNPSLTLVDELHLQGGTPKGSKLLNQARTGSVARKEPFLVSISTAPVDRSEGIFESTYQKAKRVISGEEIDPRFFAWLCQIPDHLDPEDPGNWHWSNPSLGFTVTVKRLMASLDSARSDPMALRDFRSQNLNISPDESAGIDRWLSLKEWDAAADDTLTLADLLAESELIWAGTDAGGLDDLSACALLGITSDERFLLHVPQWLSRRGFEKRKSVNDYESYIATGELTLFDGGGDDLAGIAETLRLAADVGKLQLVGIDAYGASDLSDVLSDIGVEVQSVPQGWKLTPAIAWIERRLADGKLKHSGNRLLRWNVGNAVITRAGNALSISKATAVGSGKIDGVAAMLNAVASYLANPDGNQFNESNIRFI